MNVPIPKDVKLASASDSSIPEGAVDSSGAVTSNHLVILTPKVQPLIRYAK